MKTQTTTPRYAVRVPGQTAWAEVRTITQARKEAREAADRGLRCIIHDRKTDTVVE